MAAGLLIRADKVKTNGKTMKKQPRRRRFRNNYGKSLVNPRARLVRGKLLSSLSLIPDEQPVIFKYYQSFTLTTGANPVSKLFFGNAPNDPDASSPGTGLRPLGYNEMALLYERLYCTSSRINLRIVNPNTEPVRVCIVPTPSQVTGVKMDDVISKPRSTYRFVDNNNGTVRMSNSCTTRAITGQPFDVSDDSLLMVSTPVAPPLTELNPVNQWIYNIFAQAHDGATAIALAMEVEIMYRCVLYQRVNLQQLAIGSGA